MDSLSFPPTDLKPDERSLSLTGSQTEWPTIALFLLTMAVFVLALSLPAGFAWLSFLLLVPALTLHSSLSHEILHGHPFRARWAQTALGIVQPGLFVPYLRFRALHLAHHQDSRLTDPYDDPESNYVDPALWARMPDWLRAVLNFNNTLLGRMTVGPLVGTVHFAFTDLKVLWKGDIAIAGHWLAHLPGVLLTLWLVSLSALPLWVYLLACYGTLSILKIRTFLEHRAHERASGRTVVIEDRGLLALLFLNNNYHVVHHMHPRAAWYQLPALYRAGRSHYLRRNDGYRYRSYGDIFRAHFLRAKDPVPHPLWSKEPR